MYFLHHSRLAQPNRAFKTLRKMTEWFPKDMDREDLVSRSLGFLILSDNSVFTFASCLFNVARALLISRFTDSGKTFVLR